MSTFVKATNFFPISHAKNQNIAKATSNVAFLKTIPSETSVQFADVFRSKVARCRNDYFRERTKKWFIDGLPGYVQSAVKG